MNKVPAHLFSSYQFIQFIATCLISETHYKMILDDFIANNDLQEVYQSEILDSYNFTNDIPKSDLYIRMDDSATQDRRDYITNGVRAFFRNDSLFMLDLKLTVRTLESSFILF